MTMLIGLSGAQGAGKSTLLKELVARGWELDQFRVARAVQEQLGWETLDRVLDSPETMVEFQNEVFKQKYQNDSMYKFRSAPLALTERTFADIASYTTIWSWKFVDNGKWTELDAATYLTEFTRDCADAQLECYGGMLILPMMDHIIWENDPNRAKRNDVQRFMEELEAFVHRRLPVSYPVLNISSAIVLDRALEVEDFLRNLWQTKHPQQ